MQWKKVEGDDLCLGGFNILVADTLLRIPELLRIEDPRVKERLFPQSFADEEDQAQWHRLAGTELEHLYQDQATILEKDLLSMKQNDKGEFSLVIPSRHQTAWLSALNGARLTLYILHDLKPADMEMEDLGGGDGDKDLALVRIHLLAYLQELLLGIE